MSQPQTFKCPSCGAPLALPSTDGTPMTCPYCASAVIFSHENSVPSAVQPSSENLKQILKLARSGAFADAVKQYSSLFQVNLEEAFEDIEQLQAGEMVFIKGYRLIPDGEIRPFNIKKPVQPSAQPQDFAELARLTRAGQKIDAIRKAREMFPIGLKEAKDLVEDLAASGTTTIRATTINLDGSHISSSEVPEPYNDLVGRPGELLELARLIDEGKKIEAIRLYRELYDIGLKEAKEAVERLERGEKAPAFERQTTSPSPVASTNTPTQERRQSRSCSLAIAAMIVFGLAFLGILVLAFVTKF